MKQIRIFFFQTIQLKIRFLQREENMLQWAIKGRFPVGGVDIGVLIWGDPWGGKNAAPGARHVPPHRSSVRATAADPQVQMQRAPAVRALAFYLPTRCFYSPGSPPHHGVFLKASVHTSAADLRVE